jgi:hypothetical protein
MWARMQRLVCRQGCRLVQACTWGKGRSSLVGWCKGEYRSQEVGRSRKEANVKHPKYAQ